MYKIKIAKDEHEAKSAYELFYRSFGPTYHDTKVFFDVTRKYDSTLINENLFIVLDENKNVVATCRTVTRHLKILGKTFDIGGIATTVVHPAHRGKGLFTLLTNYVLEEMTRRDFSLCMVFARRAIDYIYVKHGFWGASVERRFTVLDPPTWDKNLILFKKLQISDIPFLEKTYRQVYKETPVWLDRPKQLWMTKMKNPSFQKQFDGYLCTQKNTSKPVGYVIAEKEMGIVEVCSHVDSVEIYKSILFSNNSPVREASLKSICLSTEHPALKTLKGYSYSIFTRHPNYGGHVLKILNPYNSESKLMSMLTSKLDDCGISIPKNTTRIPPHLFSRVLTAALFGYEVPETRSVLHAKDYLRWDHLKPLDFLFSPLDEF